MASKDSGEIATNSNYALGDYSFRIERTSVPGSSNDKIEAICTDKDGKNARKSIQIPSSDSLAGWYVEANETEATVYANIGDINIVPVSCAPSGQIKANGQGDYLVNYVFTSGSGVMTFYSPDYRHFDVIGASSSPGSVLTRTAPGHESDTNYSLNSTYELDGKIVYYTHISSTSVNPIILMTPSADHATPYDETAWGMVYGAYSGPTKAVIVGRFAIDLEDAGGDGPGSDWIDPGDYDPDWEEGDPTHTLYVTVTGALSGRHNDPVEDPSYSYIPADKNTVKNYGCGGDGGHGGGGGAGASTVVVHKFATNQANSKEVTAIARRHGYGSGGGKGGKGGDGCILIYY